MGASVERAEWLTLTAGEQVEWAGRPTILTIVPQLLIAAGLVVLGLLVYAIGGPALREVGGDGSQSVVTALTLALLLGGILLGLWWYLRWLRIVYVVTTEEIYVKLGLFSRDVTQTRLEQVQNTTYSQSILGRLLSYGDVKIYTAGTHTEDLLLRSVRDPTYVNRVITQLLSDQTREQRADAQHGERAPPE